MHDASPAPFVPLHSSNADVVRGAARFLRTMRFRRSYVFAAMLTAVLLGGLYYSAAPRLYRATATLMVVQAGGEAWDPSMASDSHQQDLIPTFEKLFLQAVVVDGALQRIRELPQELRRDFDELPAESWSKAIRENLAVRTVRETKLIELSFLSRSPRAAEAVLQSVLDSYLEFMEQTHRNVSVEIVQMLGAEQKQVARDLDEKQTRFRELSRSAESLGLRNHQTAIHPTVARVIQLNETLTDVRKERLQLEAAAEAVSDAIQNGYDLRPHLMTLEPALGRELVMGAMGLDQASRETANSTSEQLLKDRARLESLLQHYGERHPEIVQLRRQVADAELLLAQQSARQGGAANSANPQFAAILMSLVNGRLSEAREYETLVQEQYAQATGAATELQDQMVELSLVEHDIQLLRNLHDTLSGRINDLGLKQNHSDVRWAVVSHPAASDRPVSPRIPVVVACCLLGGLFAGTATVYVVDLLDDRFRSPQEISQQIGLPVLAVVQKLPELNATGAEAIQVYVSPNSGPSEPFHTLRTTLALTTENCQRTSVTSSEPGDGKTTTISNLAASMASSGKRVLLIDADMRRPALHRLFGKDHSDGLSNILRITTEFAECCPSRIVRTGVPGLDLLPSGPKPADAADLLSRQRFADLIGWAETVYDRVLVDCPPTLVASDAAIVSRIVENTLLVVQPGKNHRRVVVRAVESLQRVRANITGVVVNHVAEGGAAEYYGYGHYGYGEENELELQTSEHRLAA